MCIIHNDNIIQSDSSGTLTPIVSFDNEYILIFGIFKEWCPLVIPTPFFFKRQLSFFPVNTLSDDIFENVDPSKWKSKRAVFELSVKHPIFNCNK